MISTHLKQVTLQPDGTALDAATGETYQLNRTGRYILRQFFGGEDPTGVAEQLAHDYGIPEERARQDVSAFLRQLRQLGLNGRTAG